MKIFTGLVSRGNENWIVKVQGLPEGSTVIAMGKTWKKAQMAAQEGIEVALKEPPKSVVVDLEFEDRGLEKLVKNVMEKKARVREAHAELDIALGFASRELTKHATLRDVGEMLGYSHQHIGKMASRRDGEPAS